MAHFEQKFEFWPSVWCLPSILGARTTHSLCSKLRFMFSYIKMSQPVYFDENGQNYSGDVTHDKLFWTSFLLPAVYQAP